MDAEFEQRWHSNLPPFDGLTVTLIDYIPLPLLQQSLIVVVDRLNSYQPDACLFRLLDWHTHDGFVLEAQPSSWQALRALAASEASLTACFYGGDTRVHEGFFPEERDWYLRFYVISPSEDSCLLQKGIFDLTCSQPLATTICKAFRTAGLSTLQTHPAKAFFDAQYKGE